MTDAEFLETEVWSLVFEDRCVACHQASGLAGNTRMVFQTAGTPGWQAHNLEQVTNVVNAAYDGVPLILLKPTGEHPQGHVGGRLIGRDGPERGKLTALVDRILGDVDDCGQRVGTEPPVDPVTSCDELVPGRRLLRRLSHIEYQNTLRDLLGVEIDAKGAFVSDVVDHGFDNHPEKLNVTGLLADQYREMAETIAERVSLESYLTCTIAQGDAACAHRFIATFGLRAYRRPLTADEIASYRAIYRLAASQECFEQGVRWIIIAMLQSPHFLYRSELGYRSDGDRFTLTSYEIASELSYLVWQTMPDTALFSAAAAGELLEPESRLAHGRRLLADERSTAMMNYFVGKWLQLDQLMQVVRDAEIYAALYFELREAMLMETQHFVEALWTADAAFSELFLSGETWLNQELAAYYQTSLAGSELNAGGFGRVDVSELRSGGILSQGSFVTTHSSPTSSSPIHRGVIVRERILCNELQPPPEGLVVVPPPFDPTLTTRERFAAHSSDPQCQSCHRLIDPIGLGFEHYDGIGRYREMDSGSAVDSTGRLVRLSGSDESFDGVGGLAQLLSTDDEVTDCYARQWLRFGIGETEGLDDECYVEALSQSFSSNGMGLQAPLLAILGTPHFTARLGSADELDLPALNRVPLTPGGVPMVTGLEEPPADLEDVACGVEPPVTGGAVGDGRLTVDIRDDRWATGYNRYVTVTNTGDETLNGWAISIEVDGTITNAWEVERDGDTGTVIFTNGQWNGVLAPGAAAQFGYGASL